MTVTQYDEIASSYNVSDELPYRVMEIQTVHKAISPFLSPDSKVLEFAAGTGLYTAQLIEWGLSEITAMDISAPMLELIEKRLPEQLQSGKVRVIEADGAVPKSLSADGSAGYFDLAFGCWYLNYASSKEQLVSMFQMVATNLLDGGVFVTVTPHPTEEFEPRVAAWNNEPMTSIRPLYHYPSQLDSGEGWNMDVKISDDVQFSAFHLRKSVYEEAARLGGFHGKLEWKRESFLGPDWLKEYQPDFTVDDWKIREANPMMGILIIHKNAE